MIRMFHYAYVCRYGPNGCNDPLCATEGPACGAPSIRSATRLIRLPPSSSSLPSPAELRRSGARLQRPYQEEE